MIAPRLMRAFADTHSSARFIEIGANDGVHFDPLRPYIAELDWRGVLIEPVPHVFERLVELYGDEERIRLENVAVTAEPGRREIFHVAADADPEGLPTWHDLLASFDREHVVGHLGDAPSAEDRVTATTVECVTLESICAKHSMSAPDLIMIDAEGADGEIVESIDLGTIRPRLLVFEHEHIDPAQRARCEAALHEAGYLLVADGLDTWALDVRADDGLSRRWRRITAELEA